MKDDEMVRLGRSLTGTMSPLVMEHDDGKLLTVYRYGQGYAPHALIVGTTGGGKTTLLRYITLQLVRKAVKIKMSISLADCKGSGSFLMFRDRPGIAEIVNPTRGNFTDVNKLVQKHLRTAECRFEELSQAKEVALKTANAPQLRSPFHPVFLIMDEYMFWMLKLSKVERDALINDLVQYASVGREVECHLWIALQRPDSRAVANAGLNTLLKSLLGFRVAMPGRMGMDSIASWMAFDDHGVRGQIPNRVGGGYCQMGAHETGFVVPNTPDPLDYRTSDRDRKAVWDLMPPRLVDHDEVVPLVEYHELP